MTEARDGFRQGPAFRGRPFAFVVCLLAWLAGPPAASAARNAVGIVGGTSGKVTLERDGKAYTPKTGNRVHRNDRVVTGKDGKLRILFADDSVLTVGPRSRVELAQYSLAADRSFTIRVLTGRFRMSVAKWFLGQTEGKVEMKTAVAGVRGTVLWGDTELDAVCALAGSIVLAPASAPEREAALTAGQCRSEMRDGRLTPLEPTPEQLRAFLAEVTVDDSPR